MFLEIKRLEQINSKLYVKLYPFDKVVLTIFTIFTMYITIYPFPPPVEWRPRASMPSGPSAARVTA